MDGSSLALSQRTKMIIAAAAIALLCGGWWLSQRAQPAAVLSDEPALVLGADLAPSAVVSATAQPIAVDVVGAVLQPGVYQLAPAARVQDAVRAAGGLAPDADRLAINMAAHVADAQQLRVPRVGEAGTASPAPAGAAAAPGSALIDLNTADLAALDVLPGVGPALAQRIIDYRTTNGPFQSPDDLQNVKGIGSSLYDKLKDQVTTSAN